MLLGKKAKSKGPRCFSCNKFGHIKKFCKELDTTKQKDCTKGKHKAYMTEEENPDSDCETLGFVTQAVAANVRDNKGEVWIIDSGATCHMRNNKDLLDDFVELVLSKFKLEMEKHLMQLDVERLLCSQFYLVESTRNVS